MAKKKIGKIFNRIIVQGCSLIELKDYELLYSEDRDGIITLQTNTGAQVTGVKPEGTFVIEDTDAHDVSQYAKAQVVDDNLKPENIKEDIVILGVTGTY